MQVPKRTRGHLNAYGENPEVVWSEAAWIRTQGITNGQPLDGEVSHGSFRCQIYGQESLVLRSLDDASESVLMFTALGSSHGVTGTPGPLYHLPISAEQAALLKSPAFCSTLQVPVEDGHLLPVSQIIGYEGDANFYADDGASVEPLHGSVIDARRSLDQLISRSEFLRRWITFRIMPSQYVVTFRAEGLSEGEPLLAHFGRWSIQFGSEELILTSESYAQPSDVWDDVDKMQKALWNKGVIVSDVSVGWRISHRGQRPGSNVTLMPITRDVATRRARRS